MRLKVPASKMTRGVAGMLKYASKFAMDILPSVVATIIGAYIVNHYIAAKPAEAPVAASVSTVGPKADPAKADVKTVEPSADVASIPEAGVRAKGIPEKAVGERSAVDKPRLTAPREKAVAKAIPAPAPAPQPASVSTVAPVVAATNPAPPAEAAVVPEDHRDANDLARAAIERLRAGDGSSRPQVAARAPDVTRIPDPPRPDVAHVGSTPPVRPLPPPIVVSTPANEGLDSATGSSSADQSYASERIDDPRRPTPPADIPATGPLDLRADATDTSRRPHTTVAEDMLLAAKSMFHAVLPDNSPR
jgi:hypothetical protein